MKSVGLVALFVLALSGTAFAFDGESSGFDWNNVWKMALVGAAASLLGAAKNGQLKPKDWNWKKMAQKGMLGGVIGLVAAWKGISLGSAEVMLFQGDDLMIGGLLVFGLDYAFKALFKGAAMSVSKLKEGMGKLLNPSEQ